MQTVHSGYMYIHRNNSALQHGYAHTPAQNNPTSNNPLSQYDPADNPLPHPSPLPSVNHYANELIIVIRPQSSIYLYVKSTLTERTSNQYNGKVIQGLLTCAKCSFSRALMESTQSSSFTVPSSPTLPSLISCSSSTITERSLPPTPPLIPPPLGYKDRVGWGVLRLLTIALRLEAA